MALADHLLGVGERVVESIQREPRGGPVAQYRRDQLTDRVRLGQRQGVKLLRSLEVLLLVPGVTLHASRVGDFVSRVEIIDARDETRCRRRWVRERDARGLLIAGDLIENDHGDGCGVAIEMCPRDVSPPVVPARRGKLGAGVTLVSGSSPVAKIATLWKRVNSRTGRVTDTRWVRGITGRASAGREDTATAGR